MVSLSGADLRAALELVAEAHEFETLDGFRAGILPGLLRVLPADLAGYNEVEPGGEAMVLTYPWQVPARANLELPRLAHEHPLISVQANGDRRAYKISDFLSARQFRALELYRNLYSEIGAEDQIAFGLPGPRVIGIAFNRDRRSFRERDRDLLDLLAPHLAQAYRRAVERERSADLLAALEAGLEEYSAALLLVGPGGTLEHAGEPARALLREHFGQGAGAAPPPPVAEWLAAGAPAPLRAGGASARLLLHATPRPAGGWVVRLEQERLPTPEALVRLGLTPRQAEVLALLAAGEGVAAIAERLYLSRATVCKHLEHVYARLGVHSREQALARAREAMAP
ncbi:MAG: helix-turn-helix transcriptional regulator [Solirubrobacterales bacterium]